MHGSEAYGVPVGMGTLLVRLPFALLWLGIAWLLVSPLWR